MVSERPPFCVQNNMKNSQMASHCDSLQENKTCLGHFCALN